MRTRRNLTLRSGIALDFTPTVDSTRSPRIPDGDRMWLSGGLTYKATESITLDFAYSYLFKLDNDSIAIDSNGDDLPGGEMPATSDGHVHIISLGGSYEF